MATHRQQDPKTNGMSIIAVILVAILGSFMGLEMIVTFGLSPYTAIIGILCAMLLARIPFSLFQSFHSPHCQNLLQTSVTVATFGAANALLVPIGIPFLLGREDLIVPMLIGASLAMFVDAWIIYRFFGTPFFPATESWPRGVATAKTISMGMEGGQRLWVFGFGFVIGVLGALIQLPSAAIGMAFLSQLFPMTMLAIGNLIGGFSKSFTQFDLHSLYIPHGVMIGAGIVILWDALRLFFSRKPRMFKERESESPIFSKLLIYIVLFFAFSLLLAWITGLFRSMSLKQLLFFLLITVIMQFFQRLIVGSTVMQTGFISAFSLALVFLALGMVLDFPIEALGVFAGFTAATGPVLASMGEALKTGYVLRGEGNNAEERAGKQQQLFVVWLTLLIAVLIVSFSHPFYFAQHRIPPIDHVFVATMKATESIELLNLWFVGAVVIGIVLQWINGAGVLLATGLLLSQPLLGAIILFGVILKLLVRKRVESSTLVVLAAGILSGDVIGRLSSAFRK